MGGDCQPMINIGLTTIFRRLGSPLSSDIIKILLEYYPIGTSANKTYGNRATDQTSPLPLHRIDRSSGIKLIEYLHLKTVSNRFTNGEGPVIMPKRLCAQTGKYRD